MAVASRKDVVVRVPLGVDIAEGADASAVGLGTPYGGIVYSTTLDRPVTLLLNSVGSPLWAALALKKETVTHGKALALARGMAMP